MAFPPTTAELLGYVVRPEQMTVGAVKRVDTAARIRDVHDAIDDHRRRLVAYPVNDTVLEL